MFFPMSLASLISSYLKNYLANIMSVSRVSFKSKEKTISKLDFELRNGLFLVESIKL